MSNTSNLQGLHDTGMRLAQEAMGRAASPAARPKQAKSLGLRQEAVIKAGLPQEAMAKPPKRRK